MSKIYDYHIDRQKSCQHNNIFHQKAECDDCGQELDLPEPDDNY